MDLMAKDAYYQGNVDEPPGSFGREHLQPGGDDSSTMGDFTPITMVVTIQKDSMEFSSVDSRCQQPKWCDLSLFLGL